LGPSGPNLGPKSHRAPLSHSAGLDARASVCGVSATGSAFLLGGGAQIGLGGKETPASIFKLVLHHAASRPQYLAACESGAHSSLGPAPKAPPQSCSEATVWNTGRLSLAPPRPIASRAGWPPPRPIVSPLTVVTRRSAPLWGLVRRSLSEGQPVAARSARRGGPQLRAAGELGGASNGPPESLDHRGASERLASVLPASCRRRQRAPNPAPTRSEVHLTRPLGAPQTASVWGRAGRALASRAHRSISAQAPRPPGRALS